MSKKEIVSIKGMHCVNCAMKIEKILLDVKGVISSTVDHATEKATVEYDEDVANIGDFKKVITDSGYQVIE